ncbi:MAG: aminotransferase class IV [Planctomycetaceae bacterium]
MPDRTIYFNGRFVPEGEGRVSIFDSALQFGDMAFESTRTFGGKPFRLREHLERLYGSMCELEIQCGLEIDQLEAVTHETLALNAETESSEMEWQIVHNVSRGPLPLYQAAVETVMRPTVLIYCWPLVSQMGRFAPNYVNGVPLVIPAQRHIPASLLNPHAKTRSRAHSQLALLQANRIQPGSWPLLLDPEGFVTEGTSWNVFLVKKGELITPDLSQVLEGVSRRTTIDIARRNGIPVREGELTRDDLLSADEILCTATSFCIVHAAMFEGKRVGDGKQGDVCRQLAAGWKDVVGLDFVAQAERFAAELPAWERRERERELRVES